MPTSFEDLEDVYAHLVTQLLAAVRSCTVAAVCPVDVETPTPAAWRGRLLWKDRVRPQPWDEEEPTHHIGGLRDTAISLAMLPQCVKEGLIVGKALDQLFDEKPAIQEATLQAVAEKTVDASSLEDHIQCIIDVIAKVTGRSDLRRGRDSGLDCEARPYFLGSWRQFVEEAGRSSRRPRS